MTARTKKVAPEVAPELEVTEAPVAEAVEVAEVVEAVAPEAPVEGKLETSAEANALQPPASKEQIEAAIHEKLSRRSESDGVDPFVPQTQVTAEVKSIAEQGGFNLTRGTEIGARLMARANRKAR
jgi:hypothetical protein